MFQALLWRSDGSVPGLPTAFAVIGPDQRRPAPLRGSIRRWWRGLLTVVAVVAPNDGKLLSVGESFDVGSNQTLELLQAHRVVSLDAQHEDVRAGLDDAPTSVEVQGRVGVGPDDAHDPGVCVGPAGAVWMLTVPGADGVRVSAELFQVPARLRSPNPGKRG
jgi:hypothetical protein